MIAITIKAEPVRSHNNKFGHGHVARRQQQPPPPHNLSPLDESVRLVDKTGEGVQSTVGFAGTFVSLGDNIYGRVQ